MPETPHVETLLYGFFSPDFVSEERFLASLDDLAAKIPSPDSIAPTRIHDARHLQFDALRDASFSEARFFDEHGFVLLPHESAVENWDFDPSQPEAPQDAVRTYHPEAEALIRSRLLPGRKLEVYQGPPARRGPGTANPTYALGVHQDYGLSPDDYQESLLAFTTPEIARGWRQRFDMDDVEGFMVINLWRPVYCDGPLMRTPLAVCEPHSVRLDDCVPVGLLDFTPTGLPTNQLSMRPHPDQRWYYYPAMTNDEVIAFKNFEFFKDDRDLQVEACFHSAFEDPATPPDAAERQSCEHRVSIFFLKD